MPFYTTDAAIDHDPIVCSIEKGAACPKCKKFHWPDDIDHETNAEMIQADADEKLYGRFLAILADDLDVRAKDLAAMLDRRAKRLAQDVLVDAMPAIVASVRGAA